MVISLHTWGGDYLQKDTLINMCIERDFNYIHPDFRGPNNRPQACGSELVIRDIDDAIDWALENTKTDPADIHVVGVSGGAFATVLTYLKSRHPIRSFSAYAGLYDLVDWYYESLGRKSRYATDIARVTSGTPDRPDLEEARKRSPFYMEKPVTDRSRSKLNLYCGIHDGYTGSVPVSHTLKMYNKLVKSFDPRAITSLVPEEYVHTMVRERTLPGAGEQGDFMGRKVIYKNHYQDKLKLIVFEGGHEMPPGDALAHIPSRTILAIGDSNGAVENGWPDQLKQLRPHDLIVNTSVSGNTIGFDNAGRADLNTLKNVDKILGKSPETPDAVVIMLGTNDCKAEFAGELKKVPANLDELIGKLKTKTGPGTQIFIVSPLPYGDDAALAEKYAGGAVRIRYLLGEFRRVAEKNKCFYIDTHGRIQGIYPSYTQDGIHLNTAGQAVLATLINEEIRRVWP